MGKTKTAFVTGVEEEKKTSKQKYEEKMAKKKAQEEEVKEVKGTVNVNKETEQVTKKFMPKVIQSRGKNYLAAKIKIDKSKTYSLSDAIKIIKDIKYSNFDETMELHLVVKKVPTTAQVTLPHSFGKGKRVVVASDKVITELEKNKINFDLLLATPDFMPKLVSFARVLGPKGLMPNPKNGTIIKSKKDADKFSANTLNLKTEKEVPLIHTSFGKVSMDDKKLTENAEIILKELGKNKQIVKAFAKSTMSPSIKLSI